MMLELIILALTILIAPFGGYVVGARRRAWSRRRAAMLGALPLPVTLLSLGVLLAITVWANPGGYCGIDACATEMALAITSAGTGIVLYLVSLPLAAAGALLAHRSALRANVAGEFE